MATGGQPCGNGMASVVRTCHASRCDAITYQMDPYQRICENDETVLFVGGINVTHYAVSWNGGSFAADTTFTLACTADTTINAAVRNLDQPTCPAAEKHFEISVNPVTPVTLSTGIPGDTVCEGVPIRYTVEPSGFDRYVFYNNGAILQDSSMNGYATPGIAAGNSVRADVYQDGCITQTNAVQTVTIHPPALHLTASRIGTLCTDQIVTFTGTPDFSEYFFSDNTGATIRSETNTVSLPVDFTVNHTDSLRSFGLPGYRR